MNANEIVRSTAEGVTEQPETQTRGRDPTAVSLAVSVTRLKNSRSAALLSDVVPP